MTTSMFELQTQRERVSKLYLDSIYVLDSIKGAVDYERLLLKPDLEINCNVRVQNDVFTVLHSFRSEYLRLVLEPVLQINMDYRNDAQFAESLNAIAYKRIFHSPIIAKNKRFVYTRGHWLTAEGKKAVEKHFLTVIFQIFYLMEQSLINRVIDNNLQMFKYDSEFESMNDVFSFMSRELISGKTLLPRVMERIGFKPSYVSPKQEKPDDSCSVVEEEKNLSQQTIRLKKKSKIELEGNKENDLIKVEEFNCNSNEPVELVIDSAHLSTLDNLTQINALDCVQDKGSNGLNNETEMIQHFEVCCSVTNQKIKSVATRRLSELRDLGLVADESSQLEVQESFFNGECYGNKQNLFEVEQIEHLEVKKCEKIEQIAVSSCISRIEEHTNLNPYLSTTDFELQQPISCTNIDNEKNVENNELEVNSINIPICNDSVEENHRNHPQDSSFPIKLETIDTFKLKSAAEVLDNKNPTKEAYLKQDNQIVRSIDSFENTYNLDVSIGESSFVQPCDDKPNEDGGHLNTLDKNIEEHLRQIYHTLSDVTNKTNKP